VSLGGDLERSISGAIVAMLAITASIPSKYTVVPAILMVPVMGLAVLGTYKHVPWGTPPAYMFHGGSHTYWILHISYQTLRMTPISTPVVR
jgi:hypothetical protein